MLSLRVKKFRSNPERCECSEAIILVNSSGKNINL